MNPLLGTWKLKSYVVIADTGEKSAPYGEQPIGYLSYAADGRMQVIGAASHAARRDAFFAYAGAYSVEADKITHHVDISWNEIWNGTNQVRFHEIEGDT